MGSYSYSDMKAYVKLRLGQRTDLENVSGTNMYGVWVNSAYTKLATSSKLVATRKDMYFPQLETSSTASTVDAQAYVSVPTDALIVRTVFNTTDSAKLDNITWGKYIGYTDRTNTSSETAPTEWVRSGTYLYLHPTPDKAYSLTIYYKKLVTALTGTGVTVLGAEWDDSIVSLATYIGLLYLGEFDKAKIVQAEFMENATSIANLYAIEETDRSETVYVNPLLRPT